jgi:hypothetical protein
MKFIYSLSLIPVLGYALGLYLPWWSIGVAGFIVAAWLSPRPLHAFFAGFISVLMLWGGLSLGRSLANDHILAHRFSQMILQQDSPLMLVGVTALIGALVAGFGALSGSLFRNMIRQPETGV